MAVQRRRWQTSHALHVPRACTPHAMLMWWRQMTRWQKAPTWRPIHPGDPQLQLQHPDQRNSGDAFAAQDSGIMVFLARAPCFMRIYLEAILRVSHLGMRSSRGHRDFVRMRVKFTQAEERKSGLLQSQTHRSRFSFLDRYCIGIPISTLM